MLKHILFLLLVSKILLFAQNNHVALSYEQIHSHLTSIDSQAILMGEGAKDVFIFIDPLCQFSRKFILKITENKFMLEQYKYHIFLYEIPRLHSKETINYIYNSPTQLQTLLDIMTKNLKTAYHTKNKNINQQRLSNISKVAKKIHVNKRPFIIVSQNTI